MNNCITKLPFDFNFPDSGKTHKVTEKTRSIPINVDKVRSGVYYLNLFWAKNKNSTLSHIGMFRIDLLNMVKDGYARQEKGNIIRLIMVMESGGEIVLRLNKEAPSIVLGHLSSSQAMIANLSYNIYSWRAPYINPKASHKYANAYPGHESLNFNFSKQGVDTNQFIYGYFQWTNPPKRFESGGVIIFYSKNTENNVRQA